MFAFEEKSRDGKALISNRAKESLQMKKSPQKGIECNPVVYGKFSAFRTMPMQFARTSNPFYTPEHQPGAPALTGHHIIPFSLLEHLYRLLNPGQQAVIARLAGAENDFQLDKPVADYIGWPQKNVFYGPDTSLRAEPGGKDDFDYDARFMIEQDLFQSILDAYEILKQYKNKNRLTEEQKKIVYQTLGRFYYGTAAEWPEPEEGDAVAAVLESGEEEAAAEVSESEEEFDPASLIGESRPTALQSPAEYSAAGWKEITTYAGIEFVAKYRPSVTKYSRFRLPLGGEIRGGQTIPAYDKIKKGYGGYYIYEEEGAAPIEITQGKEEGAYFIIPFNLRGQAQKVIDYLKANGAPTQTFLPKGLFQYIKALDKLQTLRGEIRSIEESAQSGQEQIGAELGWSQSYSAAPELQLDNIKLEEQAGKLSAECAVIMADCTRIGDRCPDLAENALVVRAKAEELRLIFDSNPSALWSMEELV